VESAWVASLARQAQHPQPAAACGPPARPFALRSSSGRRGREILQGKAETERRVGKPCCCALLSTTKNANKSNILLLAQLPSGSFVMLNSPAEQSLYFVLSAHICHLHG